jgi:hypothetical protein
MLRYRVYLLNDLGIIFHSDNVQAADGAAAVTAAWDLLEAYNTGDRNIAFGIEIWLGKDLIFNSWTGTLKP